MKRKIDACTIALSIVIICACATTSENIPTYDATLRGSSNYPSAPAFSSEMEPNDSFSTASFTGSMTVRGTLSSFYDIDWYLLSGQEGTHPTFRIYHDFGNDFDFEVYNNYTLIGIAQGIHNGDGVTVYTPGACTLKVYSHNGSGWYRIEIFR